MNQTRKRNFRRIRIFSALVGATLSLVSLASATLAWFFVNRTVTSDGMVVRAANDGISIDSITLCKFTYASPDGEPLYLDPSQGQVETYNFNPVNSRFEDSDGEPQTMNLYDPVLVEIESSLRDLYCNAVFIVQVSAGKSSAVLQVFAELLNKTKINDSDFFLSDCVDFDIYTPADLAAVTGDVYYPSYIEVEDRGNVTFTGYDEIFYKIAYLSENDTHAHFYGSNPKPSSIAIHDTLNPKTINFTNDEAVFYINVNYAPSQLEKYAASLAVENRNGIYDYVFNVNLI